MTDSVGSDPEDGLTAKAGDALELVVPAGWHLVHWEGFDRPIDGEGANVRPGTNTPDHPAVLEVPVPARSGDSLAGFSLWLVSDDGRAVGQLDVTIRVMVK